MSKKFKSIVYHVIAVRKVSKSHCFELSKRSLWPQYALNNTIYLDKVCDYALRTQSIRRTFRTGHEYDCRYWDLTSNVGLENLINKNIEKKISMVEYFKRKTKEELEAVL
jgi:hypothetical protein